MHSLRFFIDCMIQCKLDYWYLEAWASILKLALYRVDQKFPWATIPHLLEVLSEDSYEPHTGNMCSSPSPPLVVDTPMPVLESPFWTNSFPVAQQQLQPEMYQNVTYWVTNYHCFNILRTLWSIKYGGTTFSLLVQQHSTIKKKSLQIIIPKKWWLNILWKISIIRIF